jgi:hypothetical protein
MGMLWWRNRFAESGRIGEVGPPAQRVFLLHSPYSHFVLNGILLCEASRLVPATSEVNHESNHSRKDSPAVKVYCLPEERAQLQANATAAGMSVSSYVRNVSLGYRVRGIRDHRYVEDLIRVNGDLGRLGGLFKLWLTNEERTAAYGESRIRALLGKVEATQDELRAMIRTVMLPSVGREEF